MNIATAPADHDAHADAAPAETPAEAVLPLELAAPEIAEPETAAPEAAKPEAVAPGAAEPDATGSEPQDSEPQDSEPQGDETQDDGADTAEIVPNGFAELGLSPEIVQAVSAMGYVQPTPIQAQAIPTVLMGRDVLGCAQTGTGKTASFVLPMMDILSGSRARARMPRSLILEPTRELALQVAENFVLYGKHLKLNHALLIGGESLSDQKEALMRGVDVLIATPGRLMDLFDRGGLLLTDTNLLVIDEADRMLDMGFIPDVEKIVGYLPKNRQTLFFSATMAPEIRRLADQFLQNPKEITVSRPASVASTIVAGLSVVDDLDKREALRRLIKSEDVQNALIFCNRKRDVDILYKSLKRHGFSVGSLHGDMSQPERFATLSKFKANELRLLVCSDVAARGLDIGGLSHVFNFDVPIHAEDYVHRIGRTGRAGMTGHAYTLASPDDTAFVAAIEKLVGAPIPRILVEGFDPVEFTPDDGKKRRGRGRTAKPVSRVAKVQEDVAAVSKPRRSRARKPDAAPVELDAPQPEIVTTPPEPVAEVPVREPSRREPRRREPRREEPRVAEPRAPEPRAADRSMDRPLDRRDDRRDRYRERGRRDDDLGPAVMGFGDDIPAFMLLRSRHVATADAE